MVTLEVFQREYGMASIGQGVSCIRTTRVQQCTIWCGFDQSSGVAFLCHFDYPWSTRSVPQIVAELEELAGKNARFRSMLIGGRSCLWSMRTRRRVESLLAPYKGFITVRNGPLSPGVRGKGRSISTVNGKVRLCSPSAKVRRGYSSCLADWWHTLAIWRPAKRVRPNESFKPTPLRGAA